MTRSENGSILPAMVTRVLPIELYLNYQHVERDLFLWDTFSHVLQAGEVEPTFGNIKTKLFSKLSTKQSKSIDPSIVRNVCCAAVLQHWMAQQIIQTTLVISSPTCVVKIKRTIETSRNDSGVKLQQKHLGNSITRSSFCSF